LDLLGEAEKRDLIRSKPGQITCVAWLHIDKISIDNIPSGVYLVYHPAP